VYQHRGRLPLERPIQLPAPPPVRPMHSVPSRTGGRGNRSQRQRCEARRYGPEDHGRRRPVRYGGAQRFRRRIRAPISRGQQGVKHCKGDHVPTLRPLLAVAGPPRQYGPKPCSAWPSAGLQRPRLLRMRHEAAFRPRCCTRPLQYLFYRYCMRVRQVWRRHLLVLRRDFLAHIQNRCSSGELGTSPVDSSGTSSYGREVPRSPNGGVDVERAFTVRPPSARHDRAQPR
jgi:hypothetical protein